MQVLQLGQPISSSVIKRKNHVSTTARATYRVSRIGTPVSERDVKLPQMDEFSWTALISQHTKAGQGRQALRKYEEMRDRGVKPSSYTFVAVLKACRTLQDLDTVKQIHGQVVDSGFESVIFVGNMLVDVYSKCGSLVDSRFVFERMPHRDVVSWNTMILGCSQMQEGEEALELYGRMKQEGVTPNDRTFVAALKACSSLAGCEVENEVDGKPVKRRSLERARAIHSDIVKSGFESDVFVGNMLVDVYAKCGSFVDATRVFGRMPNRDLVSWNTIIMGCAQMGKGEVALDLYARMQQEGLIPDDRTFVGALKACSSLAALEPGSDGGGELTKRRCLEQVRAVHSEIVQSGSELDLFVGNMLVDVYAKCGSLANARGVFDKMPHRDVVSWTAIISGYAHMGEGKAALYLYTQMQQEGVLPNGRTFVAALKACTSLAGLEEVKKYDRIWSLEQVRAIHSHVLNSRCESDAFVETMLVDAYAKCGSLEDARRVFDEMHHHDVVSWTALIVGYAEMEDGQVALQLYRRMRQEGVLPNDRTFMGALKACGSLAALEKGKEIHSLISTTGSLGTDVSLASALIDMYGKCGSLVDAKHVFDALSTRDVVTWNTSISGYARLGDSKLVFDSWNRMSEEGIRPNGITFLSVLSLCSHVGLLDKGKKYFAVMVSDYGITPTVEHYNCMVDLLGRAGQLDEAMEMVKTMPFQPNGVLWRTVLSACQKWRNVELGRQAFECAVRLEKNDAAAYVLMSNIYADALTPEEAKHIWAVRLEAGAWKKPGQSSWTDSNGIVHTFVAGDGEHYESQAIYAKLGELTANMRDEGYVCCF